MGKLLRLRDGREHALTNQQIIGRLPSCDLCVTHSAVSGAHALVRWQSEGWQVRDLGSHNGTLVGNRRLVAGETVTLQKDELLTFGDGLEQWQLVCPEPPQIRVVSAKGELFPLEGTMITIPDSEEPLATIFHDGLEWKLESEAQTCSLKHNDQFSVEDRQFRFECAGPDTTTPIIQSAPTTLRRVKLCFQVSPDEEHVSLLLDKGAGETKLPERSCFYLGAVLARKRLADEQESLPEPGWIAVGDLLRMIPEYSTPSHLNVDVHRLRRELCGAGVLDAGNVIERQRGRLRINCGALTVERSRA